MKLTAHFLKQLIREAIDEAHCSKRDDIEEGDKPDFLDLDKDGNKTEPMKDAAKGEDDDDEEELEEVRGLEEKKKKACKPSKGKRFAKRVNGKCRSYGQKGKAKDGGDRIRPGTKKGDAYCARSAGIKKCKNPPCANDLSRKKWKCRGKKSMKEQNLK